MRRRWKSSNGAAGADLALDRFWERVVRGEGPAPDDTLDSGAAATIRHLHGRDDTPDPNVAFTDRLLEDLMDSTTLPTTHARSYGLDGFSPNGRAAPAVRPPTRALPRQRHGWAIGHLATVAIILLSLVGSYVVFRGAGTGLQDAPAPPADVPAYKANAARTGENPGPGPTEKPAELWRLEVQGDVRGSPAVVGGVLYVGGGDGTVYALDPASGEQQWTFVTGGPITSSPTVADGLVFIGSEDRVLYALDAATGAERWRVADAGENVGTLVVDGVVYVGAEAGLLALDAATGAERWRYVSGGAVVRNPALVDGVVYAGSADGQVNALDAADGSVIWRFQTDGGVLATPTVVDGVVYEAAFDGPADRLYALDAATGAEIWRFAIGVPVLSPTVGGGMLYLPTGDRALYALDAASGTLRWRFAADQNISAAPALVGDTLYVAGEDGNLYALDAVSGSEHWSVPVGDSGIAPVVTGGIVYVSTLGGALVALGDPAAVTGRATPADRAGTPVTTAGNAPVEYVGQFTAGANDLLAPNTVALDAEGNLFVVDAGHSRIVKFAPDGSVLASWGGNGRGDGEFLEPFGVVFDAQGNVYVSDNQRHVIQKFTPDGAFLLSWGGRGTGDGQLNGAAVSAVDAQNRVWVADFGNHRVQVFDADGNFLFKFGSRGNGDGQLYFPNEVAFDAAGNAYVTECDNHRVSKFTPDGTFLLSWDHDFRCLAGIEVDGQDRVYVADADNSRIQVFDTEGTFITMWGERGTGEGQFTAPVGMAFDDTGHVYVMDIETGLISKFRLLPPLAPVGTPAP